MTAAWSLALDYIDIEFLVYSSLQDLTMTKDTEQYIIGGNRGILNPEPDDLAKPEKVGSSVTLTRKDKVRRHCRRFWCVYLIANVIFLAIFLPIL